MAYSVPQKSTYWTSMVTWYGYKKTYMAGLSTGSALEETYYDGTACAFKIMDYTADTATWTSQVDRDRAEYHYYLNTTASPAGAAAGYRIFAYGLLEDVTRANAKASESLTNINNLLANGSYVNDSPYNSMPDATGDWDGSAGGSRECAYALALFINAARAGVSLNGTQLARRSQLLTWCLDHIGQWCTTNTARYFRPFMGALTARSLILYYTYVSQDSRIIPALKILGDYTWNQTWKSTTGSWGAANSFLYTKIFTAHPTNPGGLYDSEDNNTTPTLNNLICPYFGWLWYQTGEQKWRDRFESALNVPVYDAYGYWVSGPYLGSTTVPLGKNIDQQLYWAPEGITWAESTPVTQASGVTDIAYKTKTGVDSQGSEGGTIGTKIVTINAANTDFTIYTPAANKFAAVMGMSYCEADAHTLTFKSASTTLFQMERAANQGILQPVGKLPWFWSANAGEALKVQSTTSAVVPILFYVIELDCIVFDQ